MLLMSQVCMHAGVHTILLPSCSVLDKPQKGPVKTGVSEQSMNSTKSCFVLSSSSHLLCTFCSSSSPLVHGLCGDTELTEAELSQTELQVLGEFPSLPQNVF